MFDSSNWFRSAGRTPTLSDLDHKPFFRRHFWPPSALGGIVLSLLASVLIGFTGALIYTSSDNAKVVAVDPADQSRTLPTAPPASAAEKTTTTKPPEILNADGVTRKVGPAVWSVSTLDEAGRPIEGSGFIAGSFGGQTYLMTSLSVVRAATRIPGPDVIVRNGGSEAKATVWTWQEDRDLALLALGRSAPSLTWADPDPAAKAGDKVFVVAGGGGVVAGVVSSVSPASIQHNVFVDDKRQGAPLLNDRGQLLGMVSRSLNPNASPGDSVFFAVPVPAFCERMLSCGTGNSVQPGPGATPSTTAATTSTTVRP